MKVNTLAEMNNYLKNNFSNYIDLIRGNNKNSFTRMRKVTPLDLMLQMFAKKGFMIPLINLKN